MGWDVHLEIDAGGTEPVPLTILDRNYTWNVYPMFQAALGEDGFCNNWDGLSASVAAVRCSQILAALDADPPRFMALAPPNGWGDFGGARAFIEAIGNACAKAPLATLRVG